MKTVTHEMAKLFACYCIGTKPNSDKPFSPHLVSMLVMNSDDEDWDKHGNADDFTIFGKFCRAVAEHLDPIEDSTA